MKTHGYSISNFSEDRDLEVPSLLKGHETGIYQTRGRLAGMVMGLSC